MKRIIKVIFSIILILILAVGISIGLAFNKSGYTLEELSFKALDRVIAAEKTGGTAAFTEKEVNELLAAVYKSPEEVANITIKTPQFKFNDDKLTVGIPAIYKGVSVVVWSTGSIGYDEGNIIYNPANFKVGKFPIPKAVVLNRLKSNKAQGLEVRNEKIYINKDIVPVDISSVVLHNSILTLKIDKFDPSKLFNNNEIKSQLEALKNKLNDLRKKALSSEEKKQIEELLNRLQQGIKNPSQNILNEISNGLKDISKNIKSTEGKKQAEDIASGVDKTIEDNKNDQGNNNADQEKINLLTKARNQLSGVKNNTGSEEGNKVISLMIQTLNKLIANPSYNYSNDAAVVKGIYRGLSQNEKDALINAIMTNTDTLVLMQIANIFNLL
ncbi:hypothetical protein [Clostridium sp. HMP27]|uniref:hypothetical protein n=1 Tax=Clostridium sp. HMP27 TaxID=1487921 RepID=UPI00052BD894|nr:hypothetical protein [Clostridium sp. HMP27]KGK89572.1 hypothetical protein DP68_03740 [Clostridium sp. HMP27]